MDAAPMPSHKATARADARARRDALPAAHRARAAADACARVRPFLDALPAGAIVAAYAAIGSELDPRPLVDHALARGLRVAFPRVVAGRAALALHPCLPGQLAAGRFGIPEPPAAAPEVLPAALALALLPGLAFDRAGGRLGWGRGSYDVTLAGAPRVHRVGLAFESQLVERVPLDAHDLPVHHLATEAALYPCAAVSRT